MEIDKKQELLEIIQYKCPWLRTSKLIGRRVYLRNTINSVDIWICAFLYVITQKDLDKGRGTSYLDLPPIPNPHGIPKEFEVKRYLKNAWLIVGFADGENRIRSVRTCPANYYLYLGCPFGFILPRKQGETGEWRLKDAAKQAPWIASSNLTLTTITIEEVIKRIFVDIY